MKSTWLHALLELRGHSAHSSDELAGRLRVSQQTAARWLIQMRKDGLVSKTKDYDVSPSGKTYLSSLFLADSGSIEGRVFSGVGEGKYYLSKDGYQRQFASLLGFKPYPGTLNLRVSAPRSLDANRQLRQRSGRRLDGFKEKDRTFGGARCYPCQIDGKNAGAIIVPERTHYPEDVVELLAPVFLRKVLHVRDGDVVRLDLR